MSRLADIQKRLAQSKQPQQQKRRVEYDEKHKKLFSRPPLTCELCGYPMDYNGYKPDKWEIKWSTHNTCKEKAFKLLDRQSGIARERKN